MNLEVLHVAQCPNLTAMLQRLGQATDLPVTTREISTAPDAAAFGMAGSPTLLIDGADPFTTNHAVGALACRLYRDENGQPVPVPSLAQLRDAIATAADTPTAGPGDVLSAWRARAMPQDPVHRAVHQLVLRDFATTGQPPTAADLAATIAGSGRTSDEVLAALHDLDAIRLGADGRIEVAYPFSAHPTRHRVHLATGTDTDTDTDVYAMCAIDALGIAPMLNTDTHIDSTDQTTGQPVRITTTAGKAHWEPAGAVVFLAATTGGGPSADNCCDYLNFFTDPATANAWTTAHPHVPGQVLNQEQAETLATQLFGALLR